MTVKKIKVHRGNFTTIPNKTVQDRNLQLDTLGLLVYLLSRPGDWHFHKTELQATLNVGRERMDRMFGELMDAGYVYRVDARDAGKYGFDWHVAPRPMSAYPTTAEPTTAEPTTARPTPTKKDSTKKDETKKDGQTHAALFERLWSVYPRKVNKKGAFDKFVVRIREGVPFDDLLKATENYAKTCIGTENRFILHGATFFGPSRRWEEYLDGALEATKKKSVFDKLRDELLGGN